MELLKEAGSVLNIFRKIPDEWQTALMRTKKIPLAENDIVSRIVSREEARQKKTGQQQIRYEKSLMKRG